MLSFATLLHFLNINRINRFKYACVVLESVFLKFNSAFNENNNDTSLIKARQVIWFWVFFQGDRFFLN